MEIDLQAAEREAQDIVRQRGQRPKPERVLALFKVLRDARAFGLARKMLERAAGDPALAANKDLRREIGQKLALSTYKDADLPADQRLDDALRILGAADDLATTKIQETLGLAGAIYKRMWEQSAQERQLEVSLAYYYRGYEQGVAGDYGYTAINAAFVLDLLSDMESVAAQLAPVAAAAAQRSALARRIREEIVAKLPAIAAQPGNDWLNGTWWFLVTLGEACFGLDDCDNASAWLEKATALAVVPDWEQESSARQLAALLRIKRNFERRGGPKVKECLRDVLHRFLGKNSAAVDSVVRGKVGLALSGGGFRASFYHIGVFAKLAELDLLRQVEYLSCVSGGSIVGAHLYLEIRKLLQEKADTAITREDYVAIVRRMEKDFFDGVKTNIRTQIAAEWLTNLKMILLPAYSRTIRAGELYEKKIYSRVDDGLGREPRWLNELKVQPKGESERFSPKDNNWRRSAKVPILVLNATALNTGHNWQFTATWMGEPPADLSTEIDANYRLRRMYYTEAPQSHQRIRLGYAVGASACVPGIFEPLSLLDLYERVPVGETKPVKPVVRLVDGGVYDNQGVSALLEQGCSVLLVSDASGQMSEQDFPSNGMLGVPLRANSILQARVRVSGFGDLSSRKRGGLLKGLMFVHLKEDLEIKPVDWIDCQDPSEQPAAGPLTSYGVQRDVQRQVAAIRTDLDSFSEVEAYALMTSGYLMAEKALQEPVLGFDVAARKREPWRFLEIEPLMLQTSAPLATQLKAANVLFFKVWLLVRQLQIVAGVLAVPLVFLVGYGAYAYWETEIFTLTVKQAAVTGLATVLALLGLGVIGKLLDYRKTATEILVGLGMATFGFVFARLHLHFFDKLFLWQGSLKRLLGKTKPASPGATGSGAAGSVR